MIHGGPTGVDMHVRRADRLNLRNLGLGDYQDVISGVDALIAKGLVDKGRVGAMRSS